jgi:hypothetical protein
MLYLRDHPNAADSLKGIIVWWLKMPWQKDAVAKVEAALNVLLTQKLIHKTVIPNGEVIYSKRNKI